MPETHNSATCQVPRELQFPFSSESILRKRQAFRRELLKRPGLQPVKIAILGGSTTADVKSMLELFLLAAGLAPSFYESAYNAYYEDVLFENPELWSFKPEIVFVHTTWQNVSQFPDIRSSEAAAKQRLQTEMSRFEAFWEKIRSDLGAVIVQNNFDLPRLRPLGNLDGSAAQGRAYFLQQLNSAFAQFAQKHSWLLINDIGYLSAQVGLAEWFDYNYWYSYHMAVSPTAAVFVGQNVARIIQSIYGKSKKCLVLDLDNTLWGGVIGDDGLANLVLGRDHPLGEAFQSFQRYAKELRDRGILLAVCSKNDEENARQGFSHPDSILKVEDFSVFKANWRPKPENIREIADQLNIGLDALVFVDDNPVERALVADQLPEVAVPEIGCDVTLFAEILEREGHFEAVRIVSDDLARTAYYRSNADRSSFQSKFENYGEFLAALEMTAEIASFQPVYLERITQLINKTNQFNLTTRRYTRTEVESVSVHPAYITLYGRLCDKYGDNGLVSAIIAKVKDGIAEIELWLMSCRVLKREMECAMFDAFVEECIVRGIQTIIGAYIPSQKNGMVANLYPEMGFRCIEQESQDCTRWQYQIPLGYQLKSQYISRIMPKIATVCGD